MLSINNLEEYTEFITSRQLVVIKFFSNGCAPCRTIAPEVEKLEKQTPEVAFGQIDTTKAGVIAQELKITGIPTFIFYNNGQEISRFSDASVAKLNKNLEILKSYEGQQSTIPNSINGEIEFQRLELLNVGSTGKDLFKSGESLTTTDADDQLLAFIPFRNRVTVTSILLKVAEDAVPTHIKAFVSLVSPLSFEDAATHKAQLDQELGEPSDGWIEIKLRLVNFKNISSLLLFITGEDEDEPISLHQVVLTGKATEQAQGSIHDE